jgi:membrane protease YdiL (CAAX protease family)
MSDASGPLPLETSRAGLVAALAFAMLLPSATSWLYFVWLAGDESMRAVYAVSKVVQFVFPLAWVFFVARRRLRFARQNVARNLVAGVAVGGLMCLAGFAAYHAYFKHSAWLLQAPELIGKRLIDMRLADAGLEMIGKASPLRYLLFGLFVMVPHAALEEYYWRWFVFGELRRVVRDGWAIGLSSLGFMAHHVIVLDGFFEANWPATLTFSLCVALGGAVWAWMYRRTGSLYGPWAAHMMVDAGIFFIGYDLVWLTP